MDRGSVAAGLRRVLTGFLVLTAASCGRVARAPQSPTATPAPTVGGLDWRALESPLLHNHRQLTQSDSVPTGPSFIKAGESYFDHERPPRSIVFQGIQRPAPGAEADPFYAMYVADLRRDGRGSVIGIDPPTQMSPEHTANTCGWFHPADRTRVLFGSTISRPADDQPAGFQVQSRRYVWMFPKEMDIVQANRRGKLPAVGAQVMPIIQRPNYDAECSYSRDGRFILYSHVRDEPTRGRADADIWIRDTQTGEDHEIVHADGYDGGPFFSPDGKMICYRSDRRGDDLLQLFVSVLRFDKRGVPVGIDSEHPITDDQNVNWAPFWHPSGKFLVFGSSAVGHTNYEVYAVEVDLSKPASALRKRRVTFAAGADVLPAFSDDGRQMIWTAQRGQLVAGEAKPSSQLWVADVVPGRGGFDDPAHLFDNLPDQRPEGAAPPAPPEHPAEK